MTSRVAVLTDIHGNAPALKAVLDDIDALSTFDMTYCLGDMIAIGPDTNEVLDILVSRPNICMLRGNHEDAVLAARRGEDPGSPGTERQHHMWVASCMGRNYVPLLDALPSRIEASHGGKTLLLTHYHQDAAGRLLPVDRSPSISWLDTHYEDSNADAVCFGHHHPRHFFRSSRRIYVNPGSLGCFHRPVARYAILTCDSERVVAHMRNVPYDNTEFLASYSRLDVPAAEFIIRTFHGNQQCSQSASAPAARQD